MSLLSTLSNLATPDTVSIFAQFPGIEFVASKQALSPIPSAARARLDLAETEDVVRSYTVSRNPQARLTIQNRIRNPDTLTLGGMMSAGTLNPLFAQLGLARLDKIELAKLKTLCDLASSLFIVTPERSYPNQQCVEIREHYDESTGEGVALTLVFQEGLIATPLLIDSVLDLDALGTGAGSSVDAGIQSPAETADVSSSMSADETASVGI